MKIAGREIKPGYSPYIVAELSGNHSGYLNRAERLIEAAWEAGADAVKIQAYDPILLAAQRGTADEVLTEGPWAGQTRRELYSHAYTPSAWFPRLFEVAKDLDIPLFASVFHADDGSIDFLEACGCPAYKISSFECKDRTLIEAAARTRKPLIISTGGATDAEIGTSITAAFRWLRPDHLALLHCVSKYPCPLDETNLSRIGELRHHFQLPIGWSDHTTGTKAAAEAIEYGACIIEKHLKLAGDETGVDAAFSLGPAAFADMIWRVLNTYHDGERTVA